MSSDSSPAAPTGGPPARRAVLDEVLRTGAALASVEVARTRALAAAGHLALDVLTDRGATGRASEMALREVASELAAAENLSDRSVQAQIGRAMTLVDDYPQTLAAWEAGVITRAHVHAIVDVGTPLPLDARAEFDLLAVATAEGLSPGRLRSRLAALAETTPLPWDRVVTHPVTGAVLHTDVYARTAAIDRYLRARDRHCRWPGCTVPAIRAEVDHTRDHALGGATHVANLAHLCQRHHTQKQFTRWRVDQLPGGLLR